MAEITLRFRDERADDAPMSPSDQRRDSTPKSPRRNDRLGRWQTRAFAPGRRILAAFGLVQKFTLVLIILMLPIGFISWGYVSGSAADRRFTEDEIAGTKILAASIDLLMVAVEHRSEPIGATPIEAARSHLAAAIDRYGHDIDVDDEWATTNAAIRAALGVRRSDPAVRAEAVDAIRAFLITVGDRSNLTLDPELDSYYLMDAGQFRYPALVSVAGEFEYRMARLADSDVEEIARWRAVSDQARLAGLELTALSSGQRTVARESDDPAARAEATLRADDASRRADLLDEGMRSATDADWLDIDGSTDAATTRSAVEARSVALAAMPTSDALREAWGSSLARLDHLLRVRLGAMDERAQRFLAGAAACLVVAMYLLLSLFSGLLRSLREIRGVLVRAGEGDLDAVLDPVGSDELAEVSRAINDTVARVAAAQGELERRATHDRLTGLPNRGHFVDLLSERISTNRTSAPIALGYVDLDGFKAVNDLHGHHNGDHVLRVVAQRLAEGVPPGSVCARLAGDEYAILVAPGLSRGAVREAMQSVLESLSRPIVLLEGGGQVSIEGASLGLAFHDSTTAVDAEGLLAAADFAMYEAKSTAPGLVREFTAELSNAARRRTSMRSELSRAFADPRGSGFFVTYQPIMDLRSSQVVGAEALARWTSPTLGSITPSEFVPLAESIGLISELGQFVMGDACRRLARCHELRPDLFVTVNVSALALSDGQLEAQVTDAATGAGIAPESLWLELTESAMMTDPAGAARKIAALRRRGHPVAIDDFGTGYSSLSLLHSLELSALKVDRTFVEAIDDPAASAKLHILKMTLELARHLELDVVAEGIETPAQLAGLAHYGVQRGQGYLLHRPMPGPTFEDLLAERSPTSVPAPSTRR